MLVKERFAKSSSRGLYIQDKELAYTNFRPGAKFRCISNSRSRKIFISHTYGNAVNTVSKRVQKDGFCRSVIDIRRTYIKELINSADSLVIRIYDGSITVECHSEDDSQNISVCHVFEISKETDQELYKTLLSLSSIFSGSGMMDKAFKDEGFNILFGLDISSEVCKTYRRNIGDHIVNADVKDFDLSLTPNSIVKIAGSPCYGCSNNNRRTNDLYNPNNLLIKKFVDFIKADDTTLVFVLENVPQILTVGGGMLFHSFCSALKEFHITYGVLNAAQYNDPELRKRAIIIGSKIDRIELPKPILNDTQFKTVRDAFSTISENTPNQQDITKARAETIERMKYVPQGGNIMSIPKWLRPKGGHSDVFRRLEWDKPSITIVNPRKSNILHPDLNRILSVRECAALQGMPNTFVYEGTLSSKQQQVADGTPYNLMRAVARKVKEVLFGYYRTSVQFSY